MYIAVTYENGNVFQHFGHTEQFKIYSVDDGKVVGSSIVDTNGSGHECGNHGCGGGNCHK